MNVATLRRYGRVFYRDPTGAGRSDGEWLDIFNAILEMLANDYPLVESIESQTLAAGAREMPMSAPIVDRFEPALFVDNRRLLMVAPRDLPPEPPAGTPTRYAILGRTFLFDARPSAGMTFQVLAARRPPALVDDASEPAIAADYQWILPYRGAAIFYLTDQNEAAARFWEAKALERERALATAVMNRHKALRGREDRDGDMGRR